MRECSRCGRRNVSLGAQLWDLTNDGFGLLADAWTPLLKGSKEAAILLLSRRLYDARPVPLP
jgi:hypothetical protein